MDCKPMSKEATIYDIAKRLNVSVATVSRGLQNHPHTAKKTKKRILDTARELGYRKKHFARNLIAKKSGTIAVIVPGLVSNFMSSVVEGIERVASEERYKLMISHWDEAERSSSAQQLLNSRIDGLLVSLSNEAKDLSSLDPFFKREIPMIFLDRLVEHDHCTSVLIDNHRAAYEATCHLIAQGCKRIVQITAPSPQNIYADRLAGFHEALSDHEIKFDEDSLISGDISMEAGAEAANSILKMHPLPDGALVANDSCAVGCMLALKERGIKIPGDIAFAGFNNEPASTVIEPNLTTVSYSGNEVGKLAARHLINHLTGLFPIQKISTVMLRFELIVRASSLKTGK